MQKKGGSIRAKQNRGRYTGFKQAKFEKDLGKLSHQELKELLLINMYKMALLRSQLEAVTQVLVKNKLTTHEEIWKETNDNFQNSI